MNWLIACEYSGRVRRAMAARGHYVISCDLLASEDDSPNHYICDVRTLLKEGWDGMICHPPCTHLASSGARWFHLKQQEQSEALDFVEALLYAPIEKIALENPIGIISGRIAKPTQIIQPWEFGHFETKATCLWLKNLPKLQPTNIVGAVTHGKIREAVVHKMPLGPNRWKDRSRTYTGIAEAMANQWG